MNNKDEYDETIKSEFNVLMHLEDSDNMIEYTKCLNQKNDLLENYVEIIKKERSIRFQKENVEKSKLELDRRIIELKKDIIGSTIDKILSKAKIDKMKDCFCEINKLISIITEKQNKSEMFEYWNIIERNLLHILILLVVKEKIKNNKDYISIQDLRNFSNDLYNILTKNKFEKNTRKDDWIDIGINIQYENLLNTTKNVDKILQTGIICIQSRLMVV